MTITIQQLAESLEAGQPDAILITPEGGFAPVNLPADPEHFAEYAAAVLRCEMVEHVAVTDRLHLWLDEEGLESQPHNELATDFMRTFVNVPSTLHVHGSVLITGHRDDQVEPLRGRDYLTAAAALHKMARRA